MSTRTRAKPGRTKLSEVARKVSVPTGIVRTGWPAVERVCTSKLGLTFDDWQHGSGRVIMAERKDGKLAAMIDGVGMSLPRQVGKTYLLAAIIFALCILRPGLLVIWSAHHSKTHNETFLAMQSFAERSKIKPYIRKVYTGSGDEEVRFLNGSRILFGARERGFGRGIPGVDVLVFDEAQILSDNALSNMLATLNTSFFGLAFFIGTPPRPQDDSEVFTRMRRQANEGDLKDGAWIEFGADPDADADDRAQWARANPSFPKRTPVESMLRLQRKLKPDDFRREGLGIWDRDTSGGALSSGRWLELSDPAALPGPITFGIDVGPNVDGERTAWLAAAWLRDDGHVHVILANRGESFPAHRLETECAAPKRQGSSFSCPPEFVDDLARAGVAAVKHTGADFTVASGGFADLLDAGAIHHGNQAALNDAVKAAKWRSAGSQSERAFQLKDIPEVGPLAAAARAVHLLAQAADPWGFFS